MSGGSFNYLCVRDTEDLVRNEEDLVDMRAELAALPNGQLALERVDSLLSMLSAIRRNIADAATLKATVDDVLHAAEWWRSADYGQDDVMAALARLNGQ